MTITHRRRFFTRAQIALLLAGPAMLALSGTVHAVSVTLTTSATKTSGITPLSAVNSFYGSHATKVTKTISSTVNVATTPSVVVAASSSAWGSAEVKSTGVVKSASGYAYLGTGAGAGGTDSRSISWTASASGTDLVVVGPPGAVDLQFILPSKFGALPDDGFDPLLVGPEAQVIDRPFQEIYADRIPSVNGPSPLDVSFHFDGVFEAAGVPPLPFSGNALLQPSQGLGEMSGSLGGQFQRIGEATDDPARVRFVMASDLLIGTFTVQANEPFKFDLNTYMSLAGPPLAPQPPLPVEPDGFFGPPIDLLPPEDEDPRGAWGAGGSLTFLLQIPLHMQNFYQMQVVPEPSTWALAAVGAFGLAIAAWRRRRLLSMSR